MVQHVQHVVTWVLTKIPALLIICTDFLTIGEYHSYFSIQWLVKLTAWQSQRPERMRWRRWVARATSVCFSWFDLFWWYDTCNYVYIYICTYIYNYSNAIPYIWKDTDNTYSTAAPSLCTKQAPKARHVFKMDHIWTHGLVLCRSLFPIGHTLPIGDTLTCFWTILCHPAGSSTTELHASGAERGSLRWKAVALAAYLRGTHLQSHSYHWHHFWCMLQIPFIHRVTVDIEETNLCVGGGFSQTRKAKPKGLGRAPSLWGPLHVNTVLLSIFDFLDGSKHSNALLHISVIKAVLATNQTPLRILSHQIS